MATNKGSNGHQRTMHWPPTNDAIATIKQCNNHQRTINCHRQTMQRTPANWGCNAIQETMNKGPTHNALATQKQHWLQCTFMNNWRQKPGHWINIDYHCILWPKKRNTLLALILKTPAMPPYVACAWYIGKFTCHLKKGIVGQVRMNARWRTGLYQHCLLCYSLPRQRKSHINLQYHVEWQSPAKSEYITCKDRDG